jgi:hypothetical protein
VQTEENNNDISNVKVTEEAESTSNKSEQLSQIKKVLKRFLI